MSTNPTHWLLAIITIGVFSFMVKDNPLFGVIEHFYVGMGAGYSAVLGLQNVNKMTLTPLLQGQIVYLIPLVLGLLVFARFIRPVSYLRRIPVAVIVAVGAALALRASIQAEFLAQIQASALPLVSLDNIIIAVGTMGVSIYFYFSRIPKGRLATGVEWLARFGRLIMMTAFGAGFANMVGTNVTRFTGRLDFLFGTWLHIIPR
jgi:hypothetical protein